MSLDRNVGRCPGCGSWRHSNRDCDVCRELGACQLCGSTGDLDELDLCRLCARQLDIEELGRLAQ